MKKIFALILAIALLMTSVAAFAESVEVEPEKPKATPNINSFATMTVKYVGAKFGNQNWNKDANYYEITLSKPVDRLLVKWAEKGAEPEELAVDENLQATALAWGHKYMPGTEQKYVTSYNGMTLNNKNTVNLTAKVVGYQVIGYDIETSEFIYGDTIFEKGEDDSPYYMNTNQVGTVAFDYEVNFPVIELDPTAPSSIDNQIESYENAYPGGTYTIVWPEWVWNPVTKTFGWTKGSIVRDSISWSGIDPKSISTVKATPDQTAFMTVQGEWAVYYNRAGKIVGIEYFDGQF